MANVIAYRVLLTPDLEDGGYNVCVPAFPAIITQGDTVEDALSMAQDAIRLEIAVARESGVALPSPDADAEMLVETVVVPAA